MSISANLRILRKKARLTQIELAEKLGISIATLRRWEAGETTPNGTRIIELANIFRVSPEDIVTDGERRESAIPAGILPSMSARTNGTNGGMLVFEGEGTRIELPPTERGYELFTRLVENLMSRKKSSTDSPNC